MTIDMTIVCLMMCPIDSIFYLFSHTPGHTSSYI